MHGISGLKQATGDKYACDSKCTTAATTRSNSLNFDVDQDADKSSCQSSRRSSKESVDRGFSRLDCGCEESGSLSGCCSCPHDQAGGCCGRHAPVWTSTASTRASTSSTISTAESQGSDADAASGQAESKASVEVGQDLSYMDILQNLFDEFARPYGRVYLLNNPDWTLFLRSFTKDTSHSLKSAKMERLYSDALQLQKDTRFRFDLSAASAGQGLCFKAFHMLLEKALPYGVARTIAMQKFARFAGAASGRR